MSGTLEFVGVGVSFAGLRALDGVSFRIQPGELCALIGPNGAGKSTLINLVSGSLAASQGRVSFRGRPVRGGAPQAMARAGLVRSFQGLELFDSLSVLDNVRAGGAAAAGTGFWRNLAWPPRRDPVARRLASTAEDALAMVGLAHRAADRAAILPAGQRRLLAIARALATGADWLLLDEPGAGLNAEEKAELVALIARLHAGGRTILFVEHDMSVVASLAQRILVLDRGRLIADGAPEQVRANPEVLRAYLGAGAGAAAAPPAPRPRPPALLAARGLGVAYGDVQALRDITLSVGAGELVAVVGANGAGKSSLLKAMAGVLRPQQGALTLDGRPAGGQPAEAMVRAGVALVPEGRELFASLSVQDNLLLGAWTRLPRRLRWGGLGAARKRAGLEQVYALFPRLAERRYQATGSLSGGEAQMVAIGRALMARPRLLLLDEPSLGLAPMLVAEILARLRAMADAGLAVLLVEQMARAALAVADHGYVLESGRLVAAGPAADLLNDDDLAGAYLGAVPEPVPPEGALP